MALPASAPATHRRPVRTVDAPRPAPTRLSVVPRRRPAVGWFVVLGGLVFALLLGVTVFQTRLAQNQLELDRVERAVDAERERFDELRLQRAELRSPAYLAAAAASIGMIPGSDETMYMSPVSIHHSGRRPIASTAKTISSFARQARATGPCAYGPSASR